MSTAQAPPSTHPTPRNRRRAGSAATRTDMTRGRSRWKQRAALLLVLLLGLTAVDRISALLVADRVANLLTAPGQSRPPTVRFNAFPFLPQLVTGRYARVDLGAPEVPVAGLRVTDLRAELSGVHLGMGTLLRSGKGRLAIDRIDVSASVDYVDLNSYLKQQPGSPHITVDRGALRLTAVLPGPFGLRQPITAAARIGLDDQHLTIQPVGLAIGRVDLPVRDQLSTLLTVRVPLSLPYGLAVTSARWSNDRLKITGVAHHVVLPAQL